MKSFIIILMVAISPLACAHSGGTNSGGCHTDSRTGYYHCH